MGQKRPRPVVLDAGGLIAVDRADRRVIRLLELAEEVHVPSAALAQAWRNPARQVRLVRVLKSQSVTIHALDDADARAVGQLCGAIGAIDVADVSVVLLARLVGGVTVTSDPDDLLSIDPTLDLVRC